MLREQLTQRQREADFAVVFVAVQNGLQWVPTVDAGIIDCTGTRRAEFGRAAQAATAETVGAGACTQRSGRAGVEWDSAPRTEG